MTRDEAEAAVPRVKAALAEVGWDVADVSLAEAQYGWTPLVSSRVPREVAWTAFLVAGLPVSCWSCDQGMRLGDLPVSYETCTHDRWSERPRLERAR